MAKRRFYYNCCLNLWANSLLTYLTLVKDVFLITVARSVTAYQVLLSTWHYVVSSATPLRNCQGLWMAIKKMNIKWRRARVYISLCGHELIAHFVDAHYRCSQSRVTWIVKDRKKRHYRVCLWLSLRAIKAPSVRLAVRSALPRRFFSVRRVFHLRCARPETITRVLSQAD